MYTNQFAFRASKRKVSASVIDINFEIDTFIRFFVIKALVDIEIRLSSVGLSFSERGASSKGLSQENDIHPQFIILQLLVLISQSNRSGK